MDTAIYLGTGALTVAWSVWIYLSWSDHAKLQETSGARFLLIIGPSGYFLLIALAGWGKASLLRLDLVGIAAFDSLTLLCWLILLIMRWFRVRNFKKSYIVILIFYNTIAIFLVVLAHLIKLFPPLLIAFANVIQQGSKINIFRFAWIGLDPETHERDLLSMLNKILIALLSYVPISLLRTLYVNRQRKKMAEEISLLEGRIKQLEQRISDLAPAPPPSEKSG